MSGAKDRTPDEFTVYNVMLPRIYYPAWQGNLLEQRCRVREQEGVVAHWKDHINHSCSRQHSQSMTRLAEVPGVSRSSVRGRLPPAHASDKQRSAAWDVV
jgi:hypothetical protein